MKTRLVLLLMTTWFSAACGSNDGHGTGSASGAGGAPCGFEMCGTTCVDTSSDLQNCGACGNACSPAASCDASACSCPGDFMPAAPTFSQTIVRKNLAQFPGLVAGVGLIDHGKTFSNALLVAFDPAKVPIGEDIDLASASPHLVRVGFGFDIVALSKVRGGYEATSGKLRITQACEQGVAGVLTDVGCDEVDLFNGFAPISHGCSLSVPAVTFTIGSCDSGGSGGAGGAGGAAGVGGQP